MWFDASVLLKIKEPYSAFLIMHNILLLINIL